MNVLITGGAGFLGQRLARALLARGTLKNAHGDDERIDRLVLADAQSLDPQAAGLDDERIESVAGDLADPALIERLVDAHVASVFHLAAVVSGQAERDFDLGMRVNLDAGRSLLEACRRAGNGPKVLFTSSVAVYGGELPDPVLDTTALNPQSSYGVQKAIGELLVADYSRKGFVDGRVARLPTISVRPGRPNQAASSFASGIIREPLNGESSLCPVPDTLKLWLSSPRAAIANLIALHDVPSTALGLQRNVNLPGLSVTVGEMIAALRRVAGDEVAARIERKPDALVERIVGSWPARWDDRRARELGLIGDEDFESVIRAYVADEMNRA
jgi:nucleoside-diphosphate-sugar epimerase